MIRPVVFLTALSCAVAVGGCASPPAGQRTEIQPGADPAAVQRVGLTEWEIVTERRPLLPGPVELHVTNTGSAPHDLVLDVAGTEVATPLLPSGEQYVLRFDAPPGQYLEAWCTVTGHHAQGMATEFLVTDG